MLKKKFGPIFKELLKFLPKKLSICSQIYGFGIRDPRSGKNLFRIPDPGVKKAPDPGSGSATLQFSTQVPETESVHNATHSRESGLMREEEIENGTF
jgi:hypothetical protein